MLQQTLSYLDNFARFTRKENVEAVERLLSSATSLSKFERAQLGALRSFLPFPPRIHSRHNPPGFLALANTALGSLCCEYAEEAKTLIPSLQDKISDDELQHILDEISHLQGK